MSVFTPEAEQPLLPATATDCWDDDDTEVLICRQVLDITHDVKSFHFASAAGRRFRFDPGQFITLDLEIDGALLSRCYTISSAPTRPYLLAITAKRVPGGRVSNWLHDNIVPGTRVTARAPLGVFTLPRRPASKYLFLSAGSGVTPMMSMTRTLYDLGSDADILFVHSARTPRDIIFRRELEAISSVMPNVRIVNLCKRDSPSDGWTGLRGRLTAAALEAAAPDLAERVVFNCGPAPYMRAVRQMLEQVGYDMRNYNEESFSFDGLPREDQTWARAAEHSLAPDNVQRSDASQCGTSFTVEFVRSGKTVACGATENVLDAALAAGLRLPSSCSQGLCGTCKSTVLSGDVEMQHNGGIRPKEIAQSKILICCSTPLTDLRIDA